MAATNRPDMIDPALLRPGRFDRMVLVGAPNRESRLGILKTVTRGMPLEGVDLGAIADRTDLYVGADLAALCREAGLAAYREDPEAEKISMRHFESALKAVGPSLDELTAKRYVSMSRDLGKRRSSWDQLPFYG